MKLILQTPDEKTATLKLASLQANGIKGIIRYDPYYKKYKVYQTSKIVRNNPYKEALEDMVFQFGHRGVKNKKPMIWTGGLSALEEAFEVLGWDNPHYLPEQGYTCEVVGCMEADTCGTHWGDNKLYLRLCSKHYRQSYSGVPMPPIKQYALDREVKRNPITGILPRG